MKKSFFYFAAAFCFLLFFSVVSCTDPDLIGVEVQPVNDQLNVTTTDTVTIQCLSVREDSVRADHTSASLLGSLNDPIFGSTNAGFAIQFSLPTNNVAFASPKKLDSIVLTLAYSGYYGQYKKPMKVSVYELTEKLSNDSIYYSNKHVGKAYNNIFAPSGFEVASAYINPKPSDSVKIGSVNKAPHLRLRLSDAFGQRFLDASGTSNLSDNTNFQNFFNGLYVKTEDVYTGGCMLYFDIIAKSGMSRLTLYYNGGEYYSFSPADLSTRINHFDHVYPSTFLSQLNSNSVGDSLIYAQSMAGVKAKILFPNINNFAALGNVVINRAELLITVEDNNTYTDLYTPPSKLSLAAIDAEGKTTFLIDQYQGDTYFGGAFSSTTRQYTFNISRHIDQIIHAVQNQYGIYLMVSGASVKADRLVIKGGKRSSNPLKLKITYTKIH
ncbi:MAG: DUF4270 domain-containing protein [Bacteroidota bacterium]